MSGLRIRLAGMGVVAALLVAGSLLASPAPAQILGAAERAAAQAARRNAARAATRAAATRASARAKDKVLGTYSLAMCGPSRRCPLREDWARSFRGGHYSAKRLGSDTTLYRVYSSSDRKSGVPGQPYSYWSRSNARGTQAMIDSALPTLRNGNAGQYRHAIVVPKGSVIYEGIAGPLPRGPTGGGNQVLVPREVLERAMARR